MVVIWWHITLFSTGNQFDRLCFFPMWIFHRRWKLALRQSHGFDSNSKRYNLLQVTTQLTHTHTHPNTFLRFPHSITIRFTSWNIDFILAYINSLCQHCFISLSNIISHLSNTTWLFFFYCNCIDWRQRNVVIVSIHENWSSSKYKWWPGKTVLPVNIVTKLNIPIAIILE